MSQIIGLSLAVFLGAVMLVNASVMLLSPRAWFKLPGWLRMNGSLTADRYESGLRSVQVRMLGAIMIALIVWCIYDSLHR